jgi:uncharacterized protein
MNTEALPPSAWPCVRERKDGVVLDVLVAPNAKRTQCMGLHDGALRVRLAAAPVEGAANEALLRWLSHEMALPRQQLLLLRGDSAKRKQVLIRQPLAPVLAWLSGVLSQAQRPG